ncbi:MAG: hypothetical protein ACNI25_02715 [Halarcobacter sp.]
MAFVNEYMTEEDIEKYQYFELKSKYTGKEVNRKTSPHSKPYWVIDRERDVWFIKITFVGDPSWNGLQTTGEEIWILHYKGTNIEVRLFRPLREGSIKFTDRPFIKIWELLSITPESLNEISNKELRELIKEALTVFGQHGMISSVEQKDMNIIFRNFEG